jgi:hypothetical protein
MKNLILAALTATTLAAPAQAENSDIGLLILGIIAGAAITDNHQPAPEPNWNNHRPRREHRQPRDWNTVCGYQTEYQHNWIITTGTNCYGEVVSVERRRR